MHKSNDSFEVAQTCVIPDIRVFLSPGDTYSFYRGPERHIYVSTELSCELSIKLVDWNGDSK